MGEIDHTIIKAVRLKRFVEKEFGLHVGQGTLPRLTTELFKTLGVACTKAKESKSKLLKPEHFNNEEG